MSIYKNQTQTFLGLVIRIGYTFSALVSPLAFAQDIESAAGTGSAQENASPASPAVPAPSADLSESGASAPKATSETYDHTISVGATAPEPEAITRSPSESRNIEEVIVTATKRAESVRDIPASITAFSGADLEKKGELSLYDFVQQSPGVTASQGGAGFTRITMRGISTDTSPYAGTPSPVGIFIGDTAFTDPYTANIVPDLSAFDLSGVQILKGPQGTLFGGSALSGAVRYELQEPVLDQWQVRGFSQYNHPDQGGQALTSGAAVNIPLLSDTLALRLDYVDRHYPGVYENERTGEKAANHGKGDQIRPVLLWEPSESWKIKLTHLYEKSETPDAIVLADSPHGPRTNDDTTLPIPSDNHFSLDNIEINYNFDDMRLVSQSSRVSKRATFDGDDTAVLIGAPPAGYPSSAAAESLVIDNSQSFSQEIRLQSTDTGPFKWIAGAYYFNYSGYFNILIDQPLDTSLTGPSSLVSSVASSLGVAGNLVTANTPLLDGTSISTSQERAVFTDLTYTLWERLDLSAGARLYSTKVMGGYVGSGVLVLAEDNGMDTDTESVLKQHGVNPKVSATYHFTKDVSLYGLAAKGFRFGGVNDIPSTATNGVPATFKSDTLWNLESGLRTSWLDNSLHADLTGFYLFYKNPIISQSTTGAIPLGYSDNVSSAISRGFELGLLWNPPINGLGLALNGGYTDSHITAPFKASNGDEVEPGQELPGATHLQYNGMIDYLKPISIFLAGANVSYTYVGKGYNDLTHDVEINDFGTLNAGLTLDSDFFSFHPKMALNFTNILNVTAPNAAATGTALVTRNMYGEYTLNPPRTISVRLSFDF